MMSELQISEKTAENLPAGHIGNGLTKPDQLMALVNTAVEKGYNIDTIQTLMDFQDHWDKKQAKKAFDAAMAEAANEIPTIKKNKPAIFDKDSKTPRYMYEDLAEIAETVKPILKKHGLSYRFRTNQNGAIVSVTCVVSHVDGHSEENTLSASNDTSGSKNAIQAVGSAVTYLERYSLKAALGLAAAEDDDAQAAGEPAVITQQQFLELNQLLDEHEINKAAFCGYMGVEAVADIPQNRFKDAKEAIKKKISKAKEAANV
ncbi:ERF family protein [Bartonella apis]|uniref:ERF family protein n=1 Tax=Bartonella apis TaxID=1686310 RepID=UPI0024306E74|nr:ERF family protein [Bartonella apis]